jgi:hypothetical protein
LICQRQTQIVLNAFDNNGKTSLKAVKNVKGNGDFPNMPLISLASEKAGRGRGPGRGEGGFLSHSLASPSPGAKYVAFKGGSAS